MPSSCQSRLGAGAVRPRGVSRSGAQRWQARALARPARLRAAAPALVAGFAILILLAALPAVRARRILSGTTASLLPLNASSLSRSAACSSWAFPLLARTFNNLGAAFIDCGNHSDWLYVFDFNSSLLPNAELIGLAVTIRRACTVLNRCGDSSLLVYQNDTVGTDHAVTSVNWLASWRAVTYGSVQAGLEDNWGLSVAERTASRLNDAEFGVVFSAVGVTAKTSLVDYISIRIAWECQEETCATRGWDCGSGSDRCGGQLNNCGNCNGHGACISNKCTCDSGWRGATCDTCDFGFSGLNCTTCNSSVLCSDHGNCSAGVCTCDRGYMGAACDACNTSFYDYPRCVFCDAGVNCSSIGTCDPADGSCVCPANFAGSTCTSCAADHFGYPNCTFCERSATCSGFGSCDATGQCACDAGYAGADCGSCDPPYTGFPNCSCAGSTCADVGPGACGYHPDGCGFSMDCGGCPTGQGCRGGFCVDATRTVTRTVTYTATHATATHATATHTATRRSSASDVGWPSADDGSASTSSLSSSAPLLVVLVLVGAGVAVCMLLLVVGGGVVAVFAIRRRRVGGIGESAAGGDVVLECLSGSGEADDATSETPYKPMPAAPPRSPASPYQPMPAGADGYRKLADVTPI